ncbi:MAG: hypothetical protein KAI62_05335, partial [Actinomycetia bacterium]|nr:hypothetical protein [Actinomycetes bacterium]
IHKLLKKETNLVEAVKFASATAALTAMKKGVIPALPTRGEVNNYISSSKLNMIFKKYRGMCPKKG